MNYLTDDQSPDGIAKVIYQSKDGRTSKTFGAMDWLAQLTTHIPGKNEQMVRYYGYYSNKSRGLRRQAGREDDVPALIDSDLSAAEFRRNWARLIQKTGACPPFYLAGSRPIDMPQMPGRNEGDQHHRGPGDYQEDSATSWDLGDQKP